MVTASARVGARSRAKLGVPSGLVLEPRKSPRLYSSSASSWASSGVAARAGTDREKARLKARNKETIFFFMIHPFFGSAPTGAKTAGQEFGGILPYIPGKGKARGREIGLGRPLREQRDEKRAHRTQTNDGSEQDLTQEKECHSQPCG